MPEADQIPETNRADRSREHGSRRLGWRNLWGFAALAGLFIIGTGPARTQMPLIWIILVIIGVAFLAGCLWRRSRVPQDRRTGTD
jgi:drug/metabolite transporter (DMT)-like permease